MVSRASDDAVMCHRIDMNDHYSYFDASITPYNFLRYSEATWRLFNNAIHYQNRLRISDYRTLHHETGFEIVSERNNTKPELFARVKIAPQFRAYSSDDVMVTSSWMVSQCVSRCVSPDTLEGQGR